MEPLYSTNQAATILGKPAVTVRKAARTHKIGVQIGRNRAFTAADIERLREIIHPHSGRPRKTQANE